MAALTGLQAVCGLLISESVSRCSGTESPLDGEETFFATVRLMRGSLDTLKHLMVHGMMLDLTRDPCGILVAEND